MEASEAREATEANDVEASFKRCKGVSSFVGVPARLFLATAAATPAIRPTLRGSALRASRQPPGADLLSLFVV